MDDFTFPATAAAAEPAALCLHHHHQQHHGLSFPHFASSPLWFPDAAVAAAALVVIPSRTGGMEDVKEPAPDAGRLKEEGEREGGGGGDEEEEEDGDEEFVCGAGDGVGGEDKMDLLWENFNEELRRAGSCSKAAACGLELSDTESEPVERGRGCAPMLRASSRAGGTGHYRRASSWVLLMRIFRRLFVVEKTITAASRRRQSRPH